MRASGSVFAALLDAARPGVTGAHLFGAGAAAYATAGFPNEERLHHQGGAIGYRARDWVAHPASTDIVTPPQAFAWNPTVTGTKIEETCLVRDDEIEVITASPDWPSFRLPVRNTTVQVPDFLVLDQ
jgi:Xaa-Pro aminopeptidase